MDSQVVSNVISSVAAIISAMGIWLTYKTLKEMKEQRLLSIKPNIGIVAPEKIKFSFNKDCIGVSYFENKLDYDPKSFYKIKINNSGNGVAKEVQFSIDYRGCRTCKSNDFKRYARCGLGDTPYDFLDINVGQSKEEEVLNTFEYVKDDINIEKSEIEEIKFKLYVSYKDIVGTVYKCSYNIIYGLKQLYGEYSNPEELIYYRKIECDEDNIKSKIKQRLA
ncbi:hypothetical protein [Clostridium paraputrificum]|uniref:hypothetical protein n=1 Tax=Clostridium paraputrificum TaxID=29363 RepID=UPI0011CC29D3|nr:hypothetical protein [Clostridium paraputrificum]